MMRARRIFVAGATGVTGRQVLSRARQLKLAVLPHVRPKHASASDLGTEAAVLSLSDQPALTKELQGCTTVMQLIGTTRKRFGQGDTYETSDVGTTRDLVQASTGAGIDHFILLSSLGAGSPIGAYLKAKARAEELVRNSGIPFTIFRPSALVGGGHHPPPGMATLTRWLHLQRWKPIPVEHLAAALAYVASARACLGEILEGNSLWNAAK